VPIATVKILVMPKNENESITAMRTRTVAVVQSKRARTHHHISLKVMSIKSPKNTAVTIRRKPALMRHPPRLIMTSVGNTVAEINLTRIGLLTRPAITPVGNMVTEMRRTRLGLPISPVLMS